MNFNYLTTALAAFCIFLLLPHHSTKKACRSHDTFMFACHHSDTNTDIYLRRMLTKLDKVLERIDNRPSGIKEKNEIEEESAKSKMIISCMMEELVLVKKGNLKTGLLAFLPNFFFHYDNKDFDHYEDVIISMLTEQFNYTQEEAEIIRKTLPERNMPVESIKDVALNKIETALTEVIIDELSDAIIRENNYIIPENLQHLAYERYRQINDMDPSKKQAIIEAISCGRIKDLYQLEYLVIDIFTDWGKQQ